MLVAASELPKLSLTHTQPPQPARQPGCALSSRPGPAGDGVGGDGGGGVGAAAHAAPPRKKQVFPPFTVASPRQTLHSPLQPSPSGFDSSHRPPHALLWLSAAVSVVPQMPHHAPE